MQIDVVQKVMKANDDIALSVRERLQAAGVVALNVMSAPGSGKTSLIEATLRAIQGELCVGVIEGDPDTALDAERIAECGAPVVQIQTAGGCHLEANLVMKALDRLPLTELDVLFIENVGNLVCPVEFDLGERTRVAMVSAPEGHDKPAKYPKLFRTADVVLLNKIDLLPYVTFDPVQFEHYVKKLNPDVTILRTSCTTNEGVDEWLGWLRNVVGTAIGT